MWSNTEMSQIVNLESWHWCKVWLEFTISMYECAVIQSLDTLSAMLQDAGNYFGIFYFYSNYATALIIFPVF